MCALDLPLLLYQSWPAAARAAPMDLLCWGRRPTFGSSDRRLGAFFFLNAFKANTQMQPQIRMLNGIFYEARSFLLSKSQVSSWKMIPGWLAGEGRLVGWVWTAAPTPTKRPQLILLFISPILPTHFNSHSWLKSPFPHSSHLLWFVF